MARCPSKAEHAEGAKGHIKGIALNIYVFEPVEIRDVISTVAAVTLSHFGCPFGIFQRKLLQPQLGFVISAWSANSALFEACTWWAFAQWIRVIRISH